MTGARWGALAAAVIVLNVSLTFANVWPTLGVRPSGELSLELALCVAGLIVIGRRRDGPSRAALRWLAVGWLLLVAGRYVEVTTASLYGRDVNLYWDLRHVPAVGAMFTSVADPWLAAGAVAGLALGAVASFLVTRWALGALADAARVRSSQWVLGGLAGVVLLLSVLQPPEGRLPWGPRVARPVTAAYARELGELTYELRGAGVRDLGPAPVLRSDLARVRGADVFVIFLESYGAVSWNRPELAAPLAESRARLSADIAATGRAVASAFVESTTFGGESWLAHISLLSGTEVRDPATNVRLMAQERDTLVKLFGRQGYRTVAIMPGMLVPWPEGAFYGFDEIYDHARLDYRGPPFGWWSINDQYALARVDASEIAPSERRPAFLFFSTITTHAPFVPTPPYQADWARLLTDQPYDSESLDEAWSAWPDWMNLGPSYVTALSYAFANIGGYLRLRADRDLVMVLVGDHQPPALVSGAGASWEVPVHVVASRPAVLDRLIGQHGFLDGVQPRGPAVARMDTLLPVLLDAFGETKGP